MDTLTDNIIASSLKQVRCDSLNGKSQGWGYSYPSTREINTSGERYTGVCLNAIDSMENCVRKFFEKGRVIVDEKDQGDVSVDFKRIELDESLLQKVAKLFKIPARELADASDVFQDDSPKQQRLIVWDYGHDRKISWSVSPKRRCRKYESGAWIAWTEESDGLIISYSTLPILISFQKFKPRDRDYILLNKKLAESKFDLLHREFPFIS